MGSEDFQTVGRQEGRVGEDDFSVTIGDDPPFVHDDRAREEIPHHRDVVGGDDHRLGQLP